MKKEKTLILIIAIIVLCMLILFGFMMINKNRRTGPGPLEPNQAHTPGGISIYKTNADYFAYIAGIVNNRTGDYKVMSWPINFGDVELIQGYILGNSGYISNISSLATDWVFFDITKLEMYDSMGYPGCLDLKKQKYPQCYGDVQYKYGQNLECDAIAERESNSDTSICPSYRASVSNILAENVLVEFYFCEYSVGTTLEEYNDIISNGLLDTLCTKII